MDAFDERPSALNTSLINEAILPQRTDSTAEFADDRDLESVVLNLKFSLSVYTRQQFFSWTQGTLQSLIEHELLICALRREKSEPIFVDTFSTLAMPTSKVNEFLRQNISTLARIVRNWENNDCRPLVNAPENGMPFANSALGRELKRLGANHIAMHGTHDATGEWASVFMFAWRPDAAGPRPNHRLELMVPLLHAAWLRTLVKRSSTLSSAAKNPAPVLTRRQQEVLAWVYRGKSNADIASILKLSPLTVKNHVQRILRRLNTTNRAHAVGKALAFGALDF